MYIGLIARRYATALADYAQRQNESDGVFKEVETLLENHKGLLLLKAALESPMLQNEEKLKLISKLIGGEMCNTLKAFVQLVRDHNREAYLHLIFYSYVEIYKRRNGILGVELTTAAPIGQRVVERIIDMTKEQTHCKEVQLKHNVNESAIGGYSLRVGDKFIDQTIATQLSRIKKQMVSKNNRIV